LLGFVLHLLLAVIITILWENSGLLPADYHPNIEHNCFRCICSPDQSTNFLTNVVFVIYVLARFV